MTRPIGAMLAALLGTACAQATVIVNYTVSAGGTNTEPLNGLAARATFDLNGTALDILLENTSTGVPVSFGAADSLLVSIGMNLPRGLRIATGDAAVIGPGSRGLAQWSSRGPGDSVAEEWLWTNDFGGDLMKNWAQVISTSDGQGGGTVTRFDNQPGGVDGPFGGIAADPPHRTIPQSQRAVSDSILFRVTLTGTMTEEELQAMADASIVEYGSDVRYLVVPEPPGLTVLGAGLLPLLLRRRPQA